MRADRTGAKQADEPPDRADDEDKTEAAEAVLEEALADLDALAVRFGSEIREMAAARPVTTVLVAFLAGLVIGRLTSRSGDR